MVVFIPIAMNNYIGMLYANMVEFVEELTYRAVDARAVGDGNERRQASDQSRKINEL
ncbi:hypothetical protein [Burkholderia pseudomallei]|uniref:hypothetical protein n=1 Tax=Burkholderia pseudomallei TaxID=28450 RepID=UPI0018DE6E10|nr:hypothetical protein [Burkholderia pseudomallei]